MKTIFPVLFLTLLILFSSCAHITNDSEKEIHSTESIISESEPKEEPLAEHLLDAKQLNEIVPFLGKDFNGESTDDIAQFIGRLLEAGTIDSTKDGLDILEYDSWSISFSDNKDRYDFYSAIESLKDYTKSPFYGISVEVTAINLVDDSPKTSGEIYCYSLVIPENNGDVLVPGEQKWYLEFVSYPYNEHMQALYFVPEQKYLSRISFQEVSSRFQLDLSQMRAIAYSDTFASPKDIPMDKRIAYILTSVQPTGAFREREGGSEYKYISVTDMQSIWLKLFDEPMPDDLHTSFLISTNAFDEQIYTLAIGWGPPFEYTNFTKYVQEGTTEYVYVDIFETPFQIGGLSSPDFVYRYTVKDGIVYSCEDVTNEFDSVIYYN